MSDIVIVADVASAMKDNKRTEGKTPDNGTGTAVIFGLIAIGLLNEINLSLDNTKDLPSQFYIERIIHPSIYCTIRNIDQHIPDRFRYFGSDNPFPILPDWLIREIKNHIEAYRDVYDCENENWLLKRHEDALIKKQAKLDNKNSVTKHK
jgi:hypothetical protein